MKKHFKTLIDKIDPRFFALNRNLKSILIHLQSLDPGNVVFVLQDENDFTSPADSHLVNFGKHPFCIVQVFTGRLPPRSMNDQISIFCPRHSRALRRLGVFFDRLFSAGPSKFVFTSHKATWFANALPQDAFVVGFVNKTSPENTELAKRSQHLFVPSELVAAELLDNLELHLQGENHPTISIVDFTNFSLANAFQRKAPGHKVPQVDHEICSYNQVVALRRRPEVFRKLPQVDPGVDESRLLLTNGSKHAEIRRLVQQAFTPRAVALYSNKIEAIATETIQGFAGEPGNLDLEDMVRGFVVESIACVFGISNEEIRRTWPIMSQRIQRVAENSPNIELSETLFFRRLYPIVEKWIDECPEDEPSVIGYIKKNHLHDSQWKHANYNNIITSLSAALGGTHHYLHQALEYLKCHEEMWRELVNDPHQIEGFITESLRFFSVTAKISLFVDRDFVLEGVHYRAGEHVRINLDKANRDPTAFEKPNEINWKRNQSKHLAFGIGEHHCLGAWLVIMMTKHLLSCMTCSPHWVWHETTQQSAKHSTNHPRCPFSTATSGS